MNDVDISVSPNSMVKYDPKAIATRKKRISSINGIDTNLLLGAAAFLGSALTKPMALSNAIRSAGIGALSIWASTKAQDLHKDQK